MILLRISEHSDGRCLFATTTLCVKSRAHWQAITAKLTDVSMSCDELQPRDMQQRRLALQMYKAAVTRVSEPQQWTRSWHGGRHAPTVYTVIHRTRTAVDQRAARGR